MGRRNYWKSREKLRYYQIVQEFANLYVPTGGRLLDVGGGVQYGAKYLQRFSNFECTSIELPSDQSHVFGEVQLVKANFMEWEPPADKYDLVLCLQVLEHLEDAVVVDFTQKLFECGRPVIISVPNRWKAGACKHHKQDPVDEAKLISWVGRDPVESWSGKRIVMAFE